jgi:hypothetical protein
MTKPTKAQIARLRELVPLADAAWIAKAGAIPLLRMPATTFAWDERMVYFANTGVADGELFVELRAFDGPGRKDLDPGEIDWCIPMAYPGAAEIERLGWTVGWGEGWSDSRCVLRLRFGAAFRELFVEALAAKKLAIATEGEETASLLIQFERNAEDIGELVAHAALKA